MERTEKRKLLEAFEALPEAVRIAFAAGMAMSGAQRTEQDDGQDERKGA